MFDLVYDTIYFASYSNFYGLSNISISSFDILLAYIVAIVCSIIVALVLRLPLLPSKPYRYSFDVSAIYPTPIIAIGILSIFIVFTFVCFGFIFFEPICKLTLGNVHFSDKSRVAEIILRLADSTCFQKTVKRLNLSQKQIFSPVIGVDLNS